MLIFVMGIFFMLHLSDIILLGDPRLRQICDPVIPQEIPSLMETIAGMYNIIVEFQEKYKAGRAIAAPQVGCMKRFVCMNVDKPIVFFNPRFSHKSSEKFILWDDCMSFPDLLVKVSRHQAVTMQYYDMNWIKQSIIFEGDLSELFQHELDHLDGILAIDRALDKESFKWRG